MPTRDPTNAPRRPALASGVRVPLTSALMVATRRNPAVDLVPEAATDGESAASFANGCRLMRPKPAKHIPNPT